VSYSYKKFYGQWFVFDLQLEPVCMCTNELDAAVVCGALNAKESTDIADNSASPKLPLNIDSIDFAVCKDRGFGFTIEEMSFMESVIPIIERQVFGRQM